LTVHTLRGNWGKEMEPHPTCLKDWVSRVGKMLWGGPSAPESPHKRGVFRGLYAFGQKKKDLLGRGRGNYHDGLTQNGGGGEEVKG